MQQNTPRTREFQAGAIFTRVGAPVPHAVGRPGVTTDAGEQQIKLRSLTASQKYLDPKRVQHYVNHPSDEPITVLDVEGQKVVYDGHHRAAAAKKLGLKTITANVRRW